ncbi:putative flavin-containing monooxygenase 2 [Oryza brachyantha]|nr:putative flavin-containing monooxygenase 2 [Oryza brachyantha]
MRFYDRVDNGSVVLVLKRCDPSFSFCAAGLVLDDTDDRVDADVVILSTGFQANRQCVYPRIPQIPQMAIIGYTEKTTNIYPYEMMAKWVAYLLDSTFYLPAVTRTERSVAEWTSWGQDMRRCSGNYFHKSCVGTITTWYKRPLCQDMGYVPRTKKELLVE